MHREDKSRYLLYIEPPASEKLKEPINDELSKLMEMALSKSQSGGARYSDLNDMGDGHDFTHGNKTTRLPSFSPNVGYRGTHSTECGERSSNCDYLLENGMITNSLSPFYVKWYRYSIPQSEMDKLKQLEDYYK